MEINLNNDTTIDLSTLIDTRLLVQANSGGGKSWLLRRILEQSHGKVQQIILDLEGEFSTLREKYDYILAGSGGDIDVSTKSAGLLAKKLLELNVSAIVDLYELNHQDRKLFVKNFLHAMINAPKDLWHPCMVVIDEAHVFCPEKGESVASEAVIDLATRGRKRGYCAILATQRLSKLSKDAAAECNNKLIGRTGLDVDMKRASEELGFSSKDQYLSLRNLEAGEFYAFGPAISKEVVKIKVGAVSTTHPKAGARISAGTISPPTEKIKSVLAELKDIPQEAKREQETLETLKADAMELRRELLQLKRKQATEVSVPSKEMIQKEVKYLTDFYEKQLSEWQKYSQSLLDVFQKMHDSVVSIMVPDNKPPEFTKINPTKENEAVKEMLENHDRQLLKTMIAPVMSADSTTNVQQKIGMAGKKIYTFLVRNSEKEFTKVQLSAVSGYSIKSSSFSNALSALNSLGFIRKNGNFISAAENRPEYLLPDYEIYTPELWINKLELAPKKMYEFLWNNPYTKVTAAEMSDIAGYSMRSSSFSNAISRLNSLGLIIKNGGKIQLNPELLNL